MAMEQRHSSVGLAPILAIVAGVLAIAGSVLNWATASSGPFKVSARGIDGWEGKLTLLCGILLLVAGVSTLTGATGGKNRLRLSALIGGAGAAGIAIYTALTAKDQVIDGAATELAKQLGVTTDVARTAIQQAIDRGQMGVSIDIGLYVVIAAGVIGIVAEILAITSSSSRAAAPSAAAGLTGWSAPAPPPSPAPPPLPAPPPPPVPEASPAETSSPWAIPEPSAPPTLPWATQTPATQATSEGGGDAFPQEPPPEEVPTEEEPPGERSAGAAPPGGTLPT